MSFRKINSILFGIYCIFIISSIYYPGPALAQGGHVHDDDKEETVDVKVSGTVEVQAVFRSDDLIKRAGQAGDSTPIEGYLPPLEEDLQLDIGLSEKMSCHVAMRAARLADGAIVDVSSIPTGKGADFRRWEVKKTRLNIDGERVMPYLEENFYVTKESFFRKPAAIVFAAIGSQYERYAERLKPGEGCHVTGDGTAHKAKGGIASSIDKAGMAAGMGLLTSQARGEIKGKKSTFKLSKELEKRLDGDNDSIEISLENRERHQEDDIRIPIHRLR